VKPAAVTRDEAQRELVLGSATLAIAAAYYVLAIRIPQSDIADVIGAQGLPKTYASLLAGLSIILIVRAVVARRTAAVPDATPATPKPGLQRGVAWRVFGMLMNGVFYILVVPWLGYILSIAALIAATVYYQGGELNRRAAAIAIGGAVFLWLLFVRLLHIAHPAGIWPSLL
jgi:putative tricarboxylic transport membrane protein